jgi:predicted AAA+ superfamily ATPase
MGKYIYRRTISDQIRSWLFKGKIIILYGPRQVGKTTLVKQIINDNPGAKYLNCEKQNRQVLLLKPIPAPRSRLFIKTIFLILLYKKNHRAVLTNR